MTQVIHPMGASIQRMDDSFKRHEDADKKNQVKIIQLVTQAEIIMKENTRLQTMIEGMPGDMQRRFDEHAEKRLYAMENRITECQKAAPEARIEAAEKVAKDLPPKMSWKQIVTALLIYVTIAGAIGTFNFYTLQSMKETIKENVALVTKVQQSLIEHVMGSNR